MASKVFLGCGIVASRLYIATTLIRAMVWQGYRSISQSVSEMSAIDTPSRPVVTATARETGGLKAQAHHRGWRVQALALTWQGIAGAKGPVRPEVWL